MSDDKEVVFLEEEDGVVSEIRLSLLVSLVRLIDSHEMGNSLDEEIKKSDPNVIVSIETANRLKQLILDLGLQSERLGKMVLLSATCPCRGKTGPYPK